MTRVRFVAWGSLCLALQVGGCATLGDYEPLNSYILLGLHEYRQGNIFAAEQAFEQALRSSGGGCDSDYCLSRASVNLAKVKQDLCKYKEAEQLLNQSLETGERVFEPEDTHIGQRLFMLGNLYYLQDRFAETTVVMKMGVQIYEKNGLEQFDVAFIAHTLAQYADALRKTNREAEAVAIDVKVNAARSHADYSKNYEKAWESIEKDCSAAAHSSGTVGP